MAKLNVTSKDGLDRFLSNAKQSDTYIAGILNPAAASEKSKNEKIFILVRSVVGFTLPLPSLPQQRWATRPPFVATTYAARYKWRKSRKTLWNEVFINIKGHKYDKGWLTRSFVLKSTPFCHCQITVGGRIRSRHQRAFFETEGGW